MSKISLIPYVCGAGASTPGAEQGPLYAYAHGLTEKLAALGIDAAWDVDPEIQWNGPYGRTSYDNLPDRGTPERFEIVSWHIQALAQNVASALERGRPAIVIGGDHSQSAGSVAGVRKALGPDARIGMIWVDAHPDLHTYESSTSKALHGIQVATLLGLDRTLAVLDDPAPVLRAEDIVYAGLRDIDGGEIENARKLGITLLTMDELRKRGVAETLQDAIMTLSANCDHIILSLDLDGFSDTLAPATGTAVPGGFMPEEILPILAGVLSSHSVPLIDIVEFNPTLPGAEKTFDFILEIFEKLMA